MHPGLLHKMDVFTTHQIIFIFLNRLDPIFAITNIAVSNIISQRAVSALPPKTPRK